MKKVLFYCFLIVVFMSLKTEWMAAQNPLFFPAVNYDVGNTPTSVFAEDLNSDGANDLVVTNYDTHDISILINQGNGAFEPAANYSVGNYPLSVFCEDFDGNGAYDIAVANQYLGNPGTDSISVLMNNVDGTFNASINYTAGNEPNAIYGGDIDGDFDIDLVVANRFSSDISVLINNGNATFQPPANYGVGGNPTSVYLADIDGDFDMDIITTNLYAMRIAVLHNIGDGTFQAPIYYGAGDHPGSVVAAHLNNDAYIDLAVSNGFSDDISILLNIGDGTFQPAVNYFAGDTPYSVRTACLDGDAFTDLIVANQSLDCISVLRGNGDGTFQQRESYDVGTNPGSVFPSDLNADSFIDVIATNESDDSVSVLLNQSITEANITGTVSNVNNVFPYIPVDLVDVNDDLYASTATDVSGFYQFLDVPNGNYTVSIVTPLGYVADNESQAVILSGSDITVDFNLTPIEITGEQRGLGFWKHQIHVYLSGHGNAQIPQSDFCEYLGTVGQHFTNNSVNPISLYTVEQPATQTDSLETAADILSVRGNVPVADRAKQHFMALLLNVASMKLHQHSSISEDNATVSQAITYCWGLLTDIDDSNDELAKDIVVQINNNVIIAAGVIPLSTPNIAYKGGADGVAIPKTFDLSQNYPNPFNPITNISYKLSAASDVTIEIFDILGRKITTLVNSEQPAGYHSVAWNAEAQSSGLYFYRLEAGTFSETRKMVLLK